MVTLIILFIINTILENGKKMKFMVISYLNFCGLISHDLIFLLSDSIGVIGSAASTADLPFHQVLNLMQSNEMQKMHLQQQQQQPQPQHNFPYQIQSDAIKQKPISLSENKLTDNRCINDDINTRLIMDRSNLNGDYLNRQPNTYLLSSGNYVTSMIQSSSTDLPYHEVKYVSSTSAAQKTPNESQLQSNSHKIAINLNDSRPYGTSSIENVNQPQVQQYQCQQRNQYPFGDETVILSNNQKTMVASNIKTMPEVVTAEVQSKNTLCATSMIDENKMEQREYVNKTEQNNTMLIGVNANTEKIHENNGETNRMSATNDSYMFAEQLQDYQYSDSTKFDLNSRESSNKSPKGNFNFNSSSRNDENQFPIEKKFQPDSKQFQEFLNSLPNRNDSFQREYDNYRHQDDNYPLDDAFDYARTSNEIKINETNTGQASNFIENTVTDDAETTTPSNKIEIKRRLSIDTGLLEKTCVDNKNDEDDDLLRTKTLVSNAKRRYSVASNAQILSRIYGDNDPMFPTINRMTEANESNNETKTVFQKQQVNPLTTYDFERNSEVTTGVEEFNESNRQYAPLNNTSSLQLPVEVPYNQMSDTSYTTSNVGKNQRNIHLNEYSNEQYLQSQAYVGSNDIANDDQNYIENSMQQLQLIDYGDEVQGTEQYNEENKEISRGLVSHRLDNRYRQSLEKLFLFCNR